MGGQENTISIITREDAGMSRTDRVELVSQELKVSVLRDHFSAFMGNLRSIVDVEVPKDLPFEVKEIQFSAEITADGEFKLLGTGVGVEVSGAMTFVLERRDKEET